MKPYYIHFSTEAEQDTINLYNYMACELGLPMTADKYMGRIDEIISSLAYHATAHPISQRASLQTLYGPLARTVHYKKISIIYNIIGSEVLIRRVIASSLIQ
jgi:hypothetical protein